MLDGVFFEFPYLSLLIIPFIVCAKICQMKLPSIYFPHTKQFIKQSIASSKILFILKWLAISMIIIALMSPVKDEPYELEPKDGYEIALILDASESMAAQGFNQNNPMLARFDAVKLIVSDFIKTRENDNIGLVVFGEYSFIASPLTYDKHILNQVLLLSI